MFKEVLERKSGEKASVFCMTYLDSYINVHTKTKVPVLQSILDFFSTHFLYEKKRRENVLGDLYIETYKYFEENVEKLYEGEGKKVLIRKSSAKRFNLSATQYEWLQYRIYKYDDIKTAFIMDKNRKKIYAYLSDLSEIAAVELIRDLIIKDQENKGTLILHAAAVEKDGEATIIAASKGSGKSTTCLEFVMKYGYRLVSGDKVFIQVKDNEVFVKGWPDYPHLGIGTLRKYDMLLDMVKDKVTEDMTSRDKILFNPSAFYSLPSIQVNPNMMLLKCCVFPVFEEGKGVTTVKKCQDCTEDIIRNLEFKNDFPISKWHDYIVVDNDRESIVQRLRKSLALQNGYELSGNLIFTPDVIEKLI